MCASLRPEFGGQRLTDRYGTVAATRAADRDAKPTTAVTEIGLKRGDEERLDCGLHRCAHRIVQHVGGNISVPPILRTQLWHPVGICHRSHVEDEIGIERDPMLVAETGEMHGDGGVTAQHLLDQPITQLARREIAGVNHGICDLA